MIKILFLLFMTFIMAVFVIKIFNCLPRKYFDDYELNVVFLSGKTEKRISGTKEYIIIWIAAISVILCIQNVQSGQAFTVLMMGWILIMISIADIKYRIIPDEGIVLIMGIACIEMIAKSICTGGPAWIIEWRTIIYERLFGMFAAFLICVVISIIAGCISGKNALGGGDIKLFAAMGLLCGFSGVMTIMAAASILSAVSFMMQVIFSGLTLNDTKPLAPYISIAGILYLASG